MLGQSNCICVCLLLLGLINILVSGEFYSSIDSMETLRDVETLLVDATQQYLSKQQKQIELLVSFVERVKREHFIASELQDQDEGILEKPLLAFSLTKRLVVDWNNLNKQLNLNQAKTDYRATMEAMSLAKVLPDQGDLQGAVRGLVRLQRLYNLTASDLADGNLNGFFIGNAMLWWDCYEMGVQLFQMADYSSAREWLAVSAKLLDVEGENASKLTTDVYEYLILTYIELGEKELAQKALEQLLAFAPKHPTQHIQVHLDQRVPKCPPKVDVTPAITNYTLLCQGKRTSEINTAQRSLHCYLDSKRHAYFTLSPLKVEQVHIDPNINIYYDVLTDEQIDAVLEKSQENKSFRSATGKDNMVSDIRISQQVWLNYSSPIMQTVRKLVGAINGFNMSNSELMQVANYGIGGHYTTHGDYLDKLLPTVVQNGNRIATNMIYLSDVPQGGYTVFPKLNVFVPPVKGAMVLWHNLFKSLENDNRTEHAGCPVLEGTKRIGNIWVRSRYQEFRRPCTLNINE